MRSKRVLATLAGASMLLPAGMASATINVPGGRPLTPSRAGTQPLQIADTTITIQPGETMAGRSDVSVDATNYHLILSVPVTTGGTAYKASVAVTSANNAVTPAELNRPVVGVFATNKDNFADASAVGAAPSGGTCLVKADTNNINWTPAAPNALVALRIDKAAYDAVLAKSTAPITIAVSLNAVATCETTKPDSDK